ncbi:SDR family NAD(P)-dependent oxidoreductase [Pseudomonas sp. JS3066]|jgi:short-subunit dehydrogenase|uniref:SDR family NAD(P)-dependent oxidoreductase n=1 Tax=unclassified Pseudomonas TaxID=196821 RepID=UPI000EAA5A4F|nr:MULTISPECIES: SDR family NAD(P)-dependent oxidoreductase [unclassified Pseudomonas]AYF90507.1 SDR family NAD(P)-dependent oxidoreductase [Pseudomonas sp. DY-1]MDH4651674.1 SDR family NAD(P)-dependent oxidoreductase [Pseudomonas sp. BN606]MRK22914.1 SDR family NAD(P)-dependent oxidoreductase [Pseudomonas sp. JG-B]WVK91894.1 SDR family NAD(P)-dependent oxidoreductase [Pseudomonas sp. JS3066]
MQSLAGKVAVITGASSGIGRALANEFAALGCHLALADVDTDGLEATASTLRRDGLQLSTHNLDVSNREAVHAFADSVLTQHGQAHLVINNAGVAVSQTIAELRYDDFEWLMGINFWGVVHGTKAFLPHLLARGEGHIVNVSSIFGIVSMPTQGAYNASKFAVRGFTEALRQELCGTAIKVSCVHPGGIRTNIARSARFYQGIDGKTDATKAAARFDKLARTSAEQAAQSIIKGIRAGQPRILIGADARLLDQIQRLMPASYPRLLAKLLKKT